MTEREREIGNYGVNTKLCAIDLYGYRLQKENVNVVGIIQVLYY